MVFSVSRVGESASKRNCASSSAILRYISDEAKLSDPADGPDLSRKVKMWCLTYLLFNALQPPNEPATTHMSRLRSGRGKFLIFIFMTNVVRHLFCPLKMPCLSLIRGVARGTFSGKKPVPVLKIGNYPQFPSAVCAPVWHSRLNHYCVPDL